MFRHWALTCQIRWKHSTCKLRPT